MTYINESSRKVNPHNNKKQDCITITNKKYWVVLTKKGKVAYDEQGKICLFSRRKQALDFIIGKDSYLKIEKLDVIITK